MTPKKVLEVMKMYTELLDGRGIVPTRIDILRSGPFTSVEICAHARFLLGNMYQWVYKEEKWGKTNRHLASVQMMLWCAGVYTLAELMDHNRPKENEIFDSRK